MITLDTLADDSTAQRLLDLAGQAVRAANHRTGRRFASHRNGWNHVPDVYRCLGELTYLTGGLAQLVEHMDAAMQAQLDAGHVGADRGSPYNARPEAAIADARRALTAARRAAGDLYDGLAAAQSAISRVHYTGPDLDEND